MTEGAGGGQAHAAADPGGGCAHHAQPLRRDGFGGHGWTPGLHAAEWHCAPHPRKRSLMPRSRAGAATAGRAGPAGSGLGAPTEHGPTVPAASTGTPRQRTPPRLQGLPHSQVLHRLFASARPPISWALWCLPGAAGERAQSLGDSQSNIKEPALGCEDARGREQHGTALAEHGCPAISR